MCLCNLFQCSLLTHIRNTQAQLQLKLCYFDFFQELLNFCIKNIFLANYPFWYLYPIKIRYFVTRVPETFPCTHTKKGWWFKINFLCMFHKYYMRKQVKKSSNARSKRVSRQCVDFFLLFLVFYAVEVRYLSSLKAWYDTFGLWLQKLLS